MISQGFNPETGDLATFLEHCERTENTDNIAMSKFPAPDEDSNTTKKKSVPRRLRNAKKEVRKFTKTPHARTPNFIVASMEKTHTTTQVSENYSWQRLQKKKSLSMSRKNTRRISRNSISCR